MVGKTISHYKIIEKIGQGGMGEVFLAHDTSLDRKVALKFLPDFMQQDPVAEKRFLREAKSAAALDHPYICHIHEVGEEDGKSFISMEYVKGETLKEKLAKGVFALKDALETATEIAEALEAAHEQNIVHRDLKPSNIMLTPDGHVKVMDFGLAKQLFPVGDVESQEQTLTASLTKTGMTLGTLAYMSPEQLRGEEVDTRSDIFSFGIVLYEMLTGKDPFKKDRPMETASSILQNDPPPLSRYMDEVPAGLQRTMRKMLVKETGRRFQHIDDVRIDLEELISEIAESSTTQVGIDSTTAGEMGLPVAARPWRSAIPWAVAALAVVLAAFALWSLSTETRFESPGLRRFATTLPSTYSSPSGPQMALSQDGTRFVYPGYRGNQPRMIYRRAMDQLEALPIAGTEGANRLFFSSDGQWVGFYAQGKLQKVLFTGGSPVTVCELDRGPAGASWGGRRNDHFGKGGFGALPGLCRRRDARETHNTGRREG
ncbi:serine/threonine protein kinase [Acidobacteria bacterium AH-259-L09]|nr:serine/threonine protein kinase [Acidobacteria bacterium AH-259-L09]